MSLESRELYQSSNGDQWLLVRDERGHVFVRHVPNAPSGGKTQDIDIGVFLSKGPRGPEHQELLRLIGSLVSEADEVRGSSIA